MLLPLSICGRKMSISGLFCPEMPFYSKLMHPSKDCLRAFDGSESTLSMRREHSLISKECSPPRAFWKSLEKEGWVTGAFRFPA